MIFFKRWEEKWKMKKCFNLKIFFLLCVFSVLSTHVFCQDSSEKANHRTALKFLESATSYVSEHDWESSLSQASMGLEYDGSISDLWYICAISERALGSKAFVLLPLLEKALKSGKWENYSRDNARLLYADLLSDTGRMDEALKVLDSQPLLYSSDAELIRVKSYYRLKDIDSVSKARNKIDGAMRIYTEDARFPLVFFMNENPDDTDENVRRIADYIVSQIDLYDSSSDLIIYSAIFSEGEKKTRLLQSFSAQGFRHPLFASASLEEGLLSEGEALDYIISFSDEKINFDLFKSFLLLLSEEETLARAKRYLEAFSGTFLFDTDSDGIENMTSDFNRGRSSSIFFDENQDGEIDLSVECDFGLPVSGFQSGTNMAFSWRDFPFLESAEFSLSGTKALEKFSFVPKSLSWSPIKVLKDEELSEKFGLDFFIPKINEEETDLTSAVLLDSSSSFEISGVEEGVIRFMLLDGNIQQALYYTDEGELYAQARFEGNLPVSRSLDSNGDGIFETTEFYAVDTEGKIKAHSLEDERQVIKNLFGVPADGAEFYLRMIQLDGNGDTVCDFTEEYLENNGKISSWDTDGDGKWNVRHVIYPGAITEESLFHIFPENSLVTVRLENGVPVKVSKEDETLSVVFDEKSGFYWLYKEEVDSSGKTFKSFDTKKYSTLAKKARNALEAQGVKGLSLVVESNGKTAICVQTGDLYFGILTEKEASSSTKEKNDTEQNEMESQ